MKKCVLITSICVFFWMNIYSSNTETKKVKAKEVPEWLSNGIMYQIWPRSFTVEGTLSAARKKLPEIKELGATIVYLCPIMLQDRGINKEFWSPRQQASHANNPRNPYRIMDYTKIDPEYGTEDDLKNFIETSHYLGLRVLMDLVYLHTGPNNVLTKNPDNYKRDSHGNFIKNQWGFYDLNYDNEELREFLLKNMIDWIKKYDFDGWRCDVSAGVPLDFWEEARIRMEKIKPDIGMLAESNSPDELIRAFDVSYGFKWFNALIKVYVNGEPATKLRETWELMNKKFPEGSLFIRWVDNHDQYRPQIIFGERGSMAANVLNFTIDGVPFIFNGQEIGDGSPYGIRYYPEKSYNDNGAINWNVKNIPHIRELRNWYKKLINLRNNETALQKGETIWLKTDKPESVIAFMRHIEKENVISIINVSNRQLKVEVELPVSQANEQNKCKSLFSSGKSEDVKLNNGSILISFGSFGYYVGKF